MNRVAERLLGSSAQHVGRAQGAGQGAGGALDRPSTPAWPMPSISWPPHLNTCCNDEQPTPQIPEGRRRRRCSPTPSAARPAPFMRRPQAWAGSATTRRWCACSCSAATTAGTWWCPPPPPNTTPIRSLAWRRCRRGFGAGHSAGVTAADQSQAFGLHPSMTGHAEPVHCAARGGDRQCGSADPPHHQGAVPDRRLGAAAAIVLAQRPAGPVALTARQGVAEVRLGRQAWPTCWRRRPARSSCRCNVSLAGQTLFPGGRERASLCHGLDWRDHLRRGSATAASTSRAARPSRP